MFAKSFLRSTGPLARQAARQVRGYAAQGASGGGLGTTAYGAIGVTALGGGYYYYANVQGKAPPIPNVPAPGQEKGQNPQGPSPPSSADAKAFTGGKQGFIPLTLKKIEDINHNTKRFIFSLPEADQSSGLNVASALVTKFKVEGMEKAVIRPYTPVSDEDTKGLLEFIIKKYPNGPMSEHIHSMEVGQTLECKGPIPKYNLEPNMHKHVALIAGGTGITPMWQIARAIFKNPEDKTKVTLLFGNISEEDILLKDKFDELENTYPQRFKAFYTLDKPPEGWEAGKGFITKDLLKTVLPEPKEENIKIFVCGPPGLYKAISGAKPSPQDQGDLEGSLKDLGYSKDQVFKF